MNIRTRPQLPDELALARARREELLLEATIDRHLDVLLSSKDVGPDARVKLRKLLAHYAKKPHPFRACVKDNMKRFGPGRTEKVCATLKDIIRGTTRWRKGQGGVAASEFLIDDDLATVLLSLEDRDIDRLELIALEASHNGRH